MLPQTAIYVLDANVQIRVSPRKINIYQKQKGKTTLPRD